MGVCLVVAAQGQDVGGQRARRSMIVVGDWSRRRGGLGAKTLDREDELDWVSKLGWVWTGAVRCAAQRLIL